MAYIEYTALTLAVAQVAQKNVGSSTLAQTFTITLAYPDGTTALVLTHVVDGVDAGNSTTVAAEIVTEFNLLTHELASVITATNLASVVILTADTAGVPFTVTYGGTGTWNNSGATNTANSGPRDMTLAANYSTGAVPVNGDSLLIGARARLFATDLIAYDQSAVTLANLDLPYGGPNIGELRFPWKISASKVVIGSGFTPLGNGTAATCQAINFGANAAKVEVLATGGTGVGGLPPILLTGSHATLNSLSVSGSSYVGWGLLPYAVTALIDSVSNAGTGQITLGTVTSLTTLSNSGTGSILHYGPALATAYVKSGTLTVFNAVVTTYYIYAGARVICNVRGNAPDVTTVYFYTGGTIDFTQDARAVVVTNVDASSGDGTILVATQSQLNSPAYFIVAGASVAVR